MKIKKFIDIIKESDDVEDDYNMTDYNKEYGDGGVSEEDALMETTMYQIRKDISKTGIKNFYVYNNKFDVTIEFVLDKTEKIGKLMQILSTLKKISTDILIQYDHELELWETTKDEPVIAVDFYYESSRKGETDAKPF
jgi:hypothetical protein